MIGAAALVPPMIDQVGVLPIVRTTATPVKGSATAEMSACILFAQPLSVCQDGLGSYCEQPLPPPAEWVKSPQAVSVQPRAPPPSSGWSRRQKRRTAKRPDTPPTGPRWTRNMRRHSRRRPLRPRWPRRRARSRPCRVQHCRRTPPRPATGHDLRPSAIASFTPVPRSVSDALWVSIKMILQFGHAAEAISMSGAGGAAEEWYPQADSNR